jgi:hypothetical protein
MQYGLDLTKAILGKIKSLANDNNGKFIIFNTQKPDKKIEICSEETIVHKLNGKYYKTSRKQFLDNLEYINKDFISFTIPITRSEWRVGPEDSHLNEHATDQVMNDLAQKILSLIN